ncbi:MAG: prepilin-type N-terminal cleavage/methylation domain-containing protein [Planctomycetota bacterium]
MKYSPRTNPSRSAALATRGFTFVEVMFATVILGIGLIMVAALLPVGMRQTTETADNVTGRAIAENGFFTLQAAANEDVLAVNSGGGNFIGYFPIGFPVTEDLSDIASADDIGEQVAVGTMLVDSTDLDDYVDSFADPTNGYVTFPLADGDERGARLAASMGPNNSAMRRTFGNRLLTSDPRFAWIVLYQRALTQDGTGPGVVPSNTITATVIALKNQSGGAFTTRDVWHPANQPHLFEISELRGETLNEGVLTPASITFVDTDIDGATDGYYSGDYPNDDYTGDIDWNSNTKMGAIAEGAYVVVANDNIETDRELYNDLEGVVLRLGRRTDDGSDEDVRTYELDPDFGLPVIDTPSGAIPDGSDENPLVWVIGRQAVINFDNDAEVTGFEGQPMPIGFFQARMPLR